MEYPVTGSFDYSRRNNVVKMISLMPKGKRGAFPLLGFLLLTPQGLIITTIIAIIFIGIPLGGLIKFLVSDKTPLIFAALFVFLILSKKRER